LRNLLKKSDEECRAAIADVEEETPQPGQVFAGVSMFYFESEGGV
jgi:hypothetical protein